MRIVHRKFKCRVWSLRHLKQNGFKKDELGKVYKTMIRPVAEYCSSVYHALINKADSLELERVQMQALKKYIWLEYQLFQAAIELSCIERLSDRREAAFFKLAQKMSDSTRYASLNLS